MAKEKACKKCQAVGHDSKGNHMFLMKDGNRYCCPRVEYHDDGQMYYEDVEGTSIGTKKVEEEEDLCTSVDDLLLSLETPKAPSEIVTVPKTAPYKVPIEEVKEEFRGIPARVLKKYGVSGSYSGTKLMSLQHTLYEVDSGLPITDKVRKLPKDFFTTSTTSGKKLKLFGQHQLPSAKRLLIVEGEVDAMSAYYMLEKYKVIVWSLPLGANIKALTDNLDAINPFLKGHKELYFSFDMDSAGQTLAKDVTTFFPLAKHLKLDRKDANEYLNPTDGKKRDPNAFVSAFWDAEPYRPPSIVRVASLLDDVLKKPVVGRPYPWPTLTDATYGRRDGEGIFVGAGELIA